jgi:hypothetical protein
MSHHHGPHSDPDHSNARALIVTIAIIAVLTLFGIWLHSATRRHPAPHTIQITLPLPIPEIRDIPEERTAVNEPEPEAAPPASNGGEEIKRTGEEPASEPSKGGFKVEFKNGQVHLVPRTKPRHRYRKAFGGPRHIAHHHRAAAKSCETIVHNGFGDMFCATARGAGLIQ